MMTSETNYPNFNLSINPAGIAILTLLHHKTDSSTFQFEFLEEFVLLAFETLELPEVKGIVYKIEDPNPDFLEDYINYFELSKDREEFQNRINYLHQNFYALKNRPKPIVALINSSCKGTLLSWMLWADYRIAVVNDRATLGFQEIKYGIYPGFVAIFNAMHQLSAEFVVPFLTQGNSYSQNESLSIGLLNQVVDDEETALKEAQSWIEHHPAPTKNKAIGISGKESILSAISTYQKRANPLIPGNQIAIHLLRRALELNFKYYLQEEAQQDLEVLSKPETLNIVRTHYYGIRQASIASTEIDFELKRLGILGAGMMGSGIAYEAARSGVDVVLKDVTIEQANNGKNYSEKITSKLVQQHKISEISRDTLLSHIHPTEDVNDLNESDLIIEAVFEDRDLKATVTKESLLFISKNGFFASNTTSLPIADLAVSTEHPENFIGLHFFSPVDRMALVEVIVGKQTSDETLNKALKVVRQLGKVPIVVHDGPAFFTSRIFFNYLLEAITMVLEGIPAGKIEEVAKKSGFAVGPLAVLDEISLALMLHVYDQLPDLHNSQQRAYAYLKAMLSQERNGRKAGKGFYDYLPDGKKEIWNDETISTVSELPDQEISKRLLHVMALDSFRCLDEGILTKPIDGDIGSVLGVGYASQTGGVFGHIDLVGIQNFVDDCKRFEKFGEQWNVPDSLVKLAERNFTFYNGFESNSP
ncbi:3-hydroxyacyl-CoA dehydrogenase NAD-binding domain-containing protein [Sphingobacterium hungaricum]|nr:3-hydroxyacyl-CoA dehydrogenase NAD-binding domain-containing protein [Sphingobacterium hungaricum]